MSLDNEVEAHGSYSGVRRTPTPRLLSALVTLTPGLLKAIHGKLYKKNLQSNCRDRSVRVDANSASGAEVPRRK